MTPSKFEIREAIETIDHELSFLEVSVNISEKHRQDRLRRWQNVRTVLTGLLKDVALQEGLIDGKDLRQK